MSVSLPAGILTSVPTGTHERRLPEGGKVICIILAGDNRLAAKAVASSPTLRLVFSL
jgi:hypothetical protein